MERLFRSRMEYIGGPRDDGCFLCRILSESDDEANLILHRRKLSFVVMNKYPYNSGHLVVAPNRHLADLADVIDEEHLEISRLEVECVLALRAEFDPHGFNLGANLGEAAGAGVPGHLHMHVVPRWPGDTNFMPVIGQSKVIPESLEETYRRLKKHFG